MRGNKGMERWSHIHDDSTKTIKNAAVLREGTLTKGWVHIKPKHIYGTHPETGTIFKKIVNGQEIVMTEDEVLDLMHEALTNGVEDVLHNTDTTVQTILISYRKVGLANKGVRIVINKSNGEIVTSYLSNEVI